MFSLCGPEYMMKGMFFFNEQGDVTTGYIKLDMYWKVYVGVMKDMGTRW